MTRPAPAPQARGATAPPAPHAADRVGQAETEESLGLPHLPHMPHRLSALGGAKHGAARKIQSLAALAARWEARTAARQAAGEAPPEPVEVPAVALPEAPREAERETVPAGGPATVLHLPRREVPPAPEPPAWPPGFLYLSGLAVRLDVALRAGAVVERCPSGALDLTLPDGRLWFLTPSTVARLAAAGLLPGHLPERVPDAVEGEP